MALFLFLVSVLRHIDHFRIFFCLIEFYDCNPWI